jgi:hypothetical protein
MIEKLKIIEQVLGQSRKINEERLFFCPYCSHSKRKLSVNVEKNVFKCWVCDSHGRDIRRIIRKFGTIRQRESWDELTNRVDITDFSSIFDAKTAEPEAIIKLPDEYKSLANKSTPISALHAIRYLRNRGLTREDIVFWKIGYCDSGEYEERIVIPSFNNSGYVNYFTARSYTKYQTRYKNPPVSKDICFNELYIDWDKDLVITEGIFDAIKAGPNSVPLLGSTLRENSKLFQKIVTCDTPVYLALDADAKKKESRIIDLFLKYDIETYKVDTSGVDDVGSMTYSQFQTRKEKATFIPSGDYLLKTALYNL